MKVNNRKYSYTLYVLLILFTNKSQTVQQFTVLPKLSIRALKVINNSTVWFGANRGVWGYTENAGKTWHVDSIMIDSIYPQFRSIEALNDSTIFLLSIGSPGYLLKTTNKGKTWRVVYKNTHPKIFFDCMIVPYLTEAWAIGDPIDNKLTLIQTTDAGETWHMMENDKCPTFAEGEACFATSNTNLDCYKSMIWFITGGKRSRLFYSSNFGNSFLTYDVPLPQGETMTGSFSMDFFNEKLGAIAGGNYDKTSADITSLAVTNDGGKSWEKIKSKTPFFGSCVQFKNVGELVVTGHDGTFTYNLKSKKIVEIKDKEESLKFYTLRFSPFGRVMWMAGNGGRIALVKDLK